MNPILTQIINCIPGLAVLVGAIKYRKLDRNSKIIWIVAWVNFITNLAFYLVISNGRFFGWHLIITSGFTIEFFALFFLFKNKFEQKQTQWILKFTTIIAVIAAVYFILTPRPYYYWRREVFFIYNVTYFIWIVILLCEQYKLANSSFDKYSPFTVYFLAIIIYAFTNIYFNLLLWNPYKSEGGYRSFFPWNISTFSYFAVHLLFTTGLITSKQKSPNPQQSFSTSS